MKIVNHYRRLPTYRFTFFANLTILVIFLTLVKLPQSSSPIPARFSALAQSDANFTIA